MMAAKSFVFRFDDVEVREREFSVAKAAQTVAVEPKAFRVLLILLRNPGRLVTKDELLNAVWGDAAVTDNSLTRSIAQLRKALGDDTHNPRYIETVATVGYRFVSQVAAVEDPSGGVAVASDRPAGESSSTADIGSDGVAVRLRRKWVFAASVAAIVMSGAGMLYLLRPLPPPRISEYRQITHDGHIGRIAGTDGSRIYFTPNLAQDAPGSVQAVGTLGGEIEKVPVELPTAKLRDLSSSGSNLLMQTIDGALWTVGALGGPPRLVSKDAEKTWHHTWSPDEKYIAYSDGRGSLYVMGSDGINLHRMVTVKDSITDIAWSPDGRRLRFTTNNALWEISVRGENLHPVLPNWKGPPGQCCGRWTPDGAFYLFLAGGNSTIGPILGGFEQIWAIDEHQRFFPRTAPGAVQLTSGPIHWDVPIPSRDGSRIVDTGTTPRGELVRFDAKSNEFHPFLGGISAEFLSFSKDGSQIAYVTYPDGILWRAKPDGTERVQLTTPPMHPVLCRWSPDGTRILFSAQRDSTHFGLYAELAQGGNPGPIVAAENGIGQVDGDWSPDGHKIVYNVDPPSLRIFDLDAHKTSRIPDSDGLYSPRWSPDGRYIAVMTSSSDALKLFDLQTYHWSTLVEQMGYWGYPTFSHDGRFLYALNNSGLNWAVYRISLTGGKPERVIDLAGVHLVGALYFWFGLDPNDSPLLLRDAGTRDIYALTLDQR
jgi:DNA-binding winged helix-turn-helix (wHTH) protein/Tol biopolymer transport system component